MTYKEKLQMEHPERVRELYIGGCKDCPKDYGYEDCEYCENCSKESITNEVCEYCWNRDVPFLKKEDLKDGMMLVRRDGMEFMYCKGSLYISAKTDGLEYLKDDLTDELGEEFDVIKIYDDMHNLISERPEKKKMTHAQLAEELGYDFEYVGD